MNRRNFLGWSAAALSGLLLPELIRPRVTTVVFGVGRRRPDYPCGVNTFFMYQVIELPVHVNCKCAGVYSLTSGTYGCWEGG